MKLTIKPEHIFESNFLIMKRLHNNSAIAKVMFCLRKHFLLQFLLIITKMSL